MQLDTIIFDLDGTLVDTAGDLSASLNHALTTLGRATVDPADVRAMVGHGARKLLERGLGATGGFSEEMIGEGLQLFLDYYAKNIAVESRPFPNVEKVLDELAAQGWKLGICTNKPFLLARDLVGELGWSNRFQALLGADSRPFRKPDPRALTETIAETGGRQAIFVGDSKTDADTAKAAGTPLVLVTFGYSTEPIDTLGADAVIDHYEKLLPAVSAIQQRFNSKSLAKDL